MTKTAGSKQKIQTNISRTFGRSRQARLTQARRSRAVSRTLLGASFSVGVGVGELCAVWGLVAAARVPIVHRPEVATANTVRLADGVRVTVTDCLEVSPVFAPLRLVVHRVFANGVDPFGVGARAVELERLRSAGWLAGWLFRSTQNSTVSRNPSSYWTGCPPRVMQAAPTFLNVCTTYVRRQNRHRRFHPNRRTASPLSGPEACCAQCRQCYP
jgi:hypothetical protein